MVRVHSDPLFVPEQSEGKQRLVPSFIALDMENSPDECIKSIQNTIKKIVYRPFNEAIHIPDDIDFTLK